MALRSAAILFLRNSTHFFAMPSLLRTIPSQIYALLFLRGVLQFLTLLFRRTSLPFQRFTLLCRSITSLRFA
jgi:hypothetical protein